MLKIEELHKILKDCNIDTADFTIQNLSEIYNMKLDEGQVMPLIEEMVLAVVDFDTPLYDVLAYANNFEEKLDLKEETSFVCDILNIVITNMPVCKENADRLIDLIEDADILDAYNALMQDYKQFLTEKQLAILTTLANNTFDKGLLV